MMLDTVALLGKFSVANLGLRDLRDGSGEATEGARELGFEQCTGSHCRARRKNRETYMPLLDGVFFNGVLCNVVTQNWILSDIKFA